MKQFRDVSLHNFDGFAMLGLAFAVSPITLLLLHHLGIPNAQTPKRPVVHRQLCPLRIKSYFTGEHHKCRHTLI